MVFEVGDRIEHQARSTERAPRRGMIEEVVTIDPAPRYRILWDDGHESVYTPHDGALIKLGAEREH